METPAADIRGATPWRKAAGGIESFIMNWANRLTLSRLGLTILFVIALNSEWQFGRTVALVLFVVAGLTDFVDGEIARRYQFITDFGKLMDPLVDKIMIAAAFISLVSLKAIPAWVAIIVVARDFLITGLRLIASSKGEILPAEKLGKHKTSWQIVTVIFFLALLAARELRYAEAQTVWWVRAWNDGGSALVWITVALTLYSGLGYAWRHRGIVATEPR
ncbi:MAG: CDP-diacylglycerol--glycerol-3-phosphate 3-phosphatidyltransferase [Limisphaerales bacterium]